jgi:ATP adenylyltransferase
LPLCPGGPYIYKFQEGSSAACRGESMSQTGERPPGPERLWAPWRIAYFTEPQPEGCIFCQLPAAGGQPDRESLILARFERVFVIMNKYPYNNGHLMVVPYQHAGRLEELKPPTLGELLAVGGICTQVLAEALGAQGFNLGFNLGRAAGAGITDHLHLHVVPRWNGDTNFMPVLGDTKVLSEALEATWGRLKPVFDRRKDEG